MVLFSRTRRDRLAVLSDDEFDRVIMNHADSLRYEHHWFPPSVVVRTFPNREEREYNLIFWQRLYLFLHNPSSSISSQWFERIMSLIVLSSVATMMASTVPDYQHTPSTCVSPACDNDATLCPGRQICQPIVSRFFVIYELICTAIFTIDFLLKLILASLMPTRLADILPYDYDEKELVAAKAARREPNYDPQYSKLWKSTLYLTSFNGFIDCLSAIPLWLYLIYVNGRLNQLDYSTQSFRALRMFRMFKLGGQFMATIRMFYRAMVIALEPLFIIAFGMLWLLVVYGIIIYELEGGTFTVNADYPSGAFVRTSPDRLSPSSAESVFDSVPTGMYYAGVTMTSLGFGDLYPYTRGGRAFAVIVAVTGVLLFSLPMTVVFTHFDREYQKYIKIVEIKKDFNKAIEKKILAAHTTTHTSPVATATDETGPSPASNIKPQVSKLHRQSILPDFNGIISTLAFDQVESYHRSHSTMHPSVVDMQLRRVSTDMIHRRRSTAGQARQYSTAPSTATSLLRDMSEEPDISMLNDNELRSYAGQLVNDFKSLDASLTAQQTLMKDKISKYNSALSYLKST